MGSWAGNWTTALLGITLAVVGAAAVADDGIRLTGCLVRGENGTGYLVTNFKGEAQKPINLNSATAVELESVAGLLRKESAALIAWRTRNVPCKSLDDLKNAPGVPFDKIDERRDRLVCIVLSLPAAKH